MRTITIDNEEWEIVPENTIEVNDYEYKSYSESKPIFRNKFTFNTIERLINVDIKTNIHFIFSRVSAEIACRLIQGEDIWDGKVDLERLNAVVFLLFKPAGRGKDLDWSPTTDQLKVFAELIKKPDSKFKIGMDSCLINKVSQVRELTALEEMYTDTCEGARMSCYITPDERLVPCSFGDHDKYGIDISKGNLKDVWWDGKPFKDFRHILMGSKACCPYTVKGF